MALHHAPACDPLVLDNAEVAMFLPVLFPNRLPQEHAVALARCPSIGNSVGLHYSCSRPFPCILPLAHQALSAPRFAKYASNPRSRASGSSPTIPLDWIGAKATTFSVAATTSCTVDYTIEGTIQDPMRVTSPSWFTLSSAHLSASSSLGNWLSPLAGIRVTSTSISSTVLTLTAPQNAGG
jgi:hypothetical protein